jgi:DNA-binding MarR family transcriptional regulator
MSNNRKRAALIGQVKIETDIFMNATKLSDKTLADANQLLSVWGMTVLQYNALRVIYVKDTNNQGLPSKEIGQRLYTRVPDVTRLLDRLADKGWITRERDTINRRVVRSRLTDIGVELVESIYKPLQELESQQLSVLTKKEKEMLSMLLKKALD